MQYVQLPSIFSIFLFMFSDAAMSLLQSMWAGVNAGGDKVGMAAGAQLLARFEAEDREFHTRANKVGR